MSFNCRKGNGKCSQGPLESQSVCTVSCGLRSFIKSFNTSHSQPRESILASMRATTHRVPEFQNSQLSEQTGLSWLRKPLSALLVQCNWGALSMDQRRRDRSIPPLNYQVSSLTNSPVTHQKLNCPEELHFYVRSMF